jgi:hypothetical protein
MAAIGELQIEQIVHGYDRGHRELAASVALDEESRATMLVMSDLIVDQVLDGDRSYLACYPLRNAAMHVLARTWPAGPNYRPGSVWTHSLLLNYQALAQFTDLVSLASYLRRPDRDLRRVQRPIRVRDEPRPLEEGFDEATAKVAIAGLYRSPASEQIVRIPDRGAAANEALALALWRQGWPGLRRDFAFVTGAAERLRELDARCILRFTPEEIDPPDLDEGQEILARDLPERSQTSLRRFLSRYAVESSDPRALAGELARLWDESNRSSSDRRIANVARLAGLHALPRLKRDLVSAELSSEVDGNSLVDLVTQFGDEPVPSIPKTVRRRLEDMTDAQLGRLLEVGLSAPDGALSQQVSDLLLNELDCGRLATLAARSNRGRMVEVRPEVTAFAAFWPYSDDERVHLLSGLPNNARPTVRDAIQALGDTIGPKVVQALVEPILREEPTVVVELLSAHNPVVAKAVASLVGRNDETAAAILPILKTGDLAIFEEIASARISSSFPLVAPILWIEAGARVGGDHSDRFGTASATLLLAAALRVGGSAGYQAARGVCEAVFTLANRYRLPREAEQWLNRELPQPSGSWSLRSRIVASVAVIWPPDPDGAGSLVFFSQIENAREIVSEINSRFGRYAMTMALNDPELPIAVLHLIEARLQPTWSPFSWLGL